MRRLVFLSVLSLSLVGLAGCGRSDNSVKVTTHSDGTQSVTVTDDKGTKVTVAGAGASAHMPGYAPLYPGATVELTVTTPDKGGMVMFKTATAPQDVIDYYKKATSAAGFKEKFTMTTGDTMSFGAATENPEHSVNVTATKGDDGTQVQVTWN